MNFIQDYIWNIFEIWHEEKCANINDAYDMFILNIELETYRYRGTKHISLKKLHKQWFNLGKYIQARQKKIFNDIVSANALFLVRSFVNNDKEEFEKYSHTI